MNVLVIGFGKSGQSACALLKAQGHDVVTVDQDPKLGLCQDIVIGDFDFVVVSPGVLPTDRWYVEAKRADLEILGEAELALREAKQPCVAITGTNGKTSVTLLIEHVLKSAGKKARALGNVGDPLAAYFLKPDLEEIIVAEISSYQLETMTSQVFDAAIILNVTPDHLDRYGSMQEYALAKFRLQSCMKKEAPFYVNIELLREYKHLLRGDYQTYGSDSGAFLWTDKCVVKELEKIAYFLPMAYREMGKHESENAVAAWAICRYFGVTSEQFLQALESFQKPAHRIEFVATIGGVSYYDDSKGTNIDATVHAIDSMAGPVILIAGGVDKGSSYAPWKKFQGKVRKIIVMGQAAQKIHHELHASFSVEIVSDMEKAVAAAKKSAGPGDAVLLSPGCSSFDMFRDYAHRGEEFKRRVKE
jgi:UDP-N-acetylmuramoylalanine--D-glutamate ligase